MASAKSGWTTLARSVWCAGVFGKASAISLSPLVVTVTAAV
jgi:hypothetical protein